MRCGREPASSSGAEKTEGASLFAASLNLWHHQNDGYTDHNA
jgi:hypothetical protein